MTTERIDIVVREDGSRVVRRNLESISGQANTTASAVDRMKQSLAGVGGILAAMGISFGVSQLIKYTDTWANLEGRLRLVTSSTAQLLKVQKDLFDVSNRTRNSVEQTIDLYARVARSTQALNATDTQRIRVTENINKSLVISGASAVSAEAALIQLGQGFASGVLRGQELNSVMEQTPRLAQAIADGMGKTIGELRAMGAEGKLTAEAVFSAIESQSKVMQAEFSKMPVTIAQSFTVMNNEIMKYIGTANNANGSAATLSGTILFLAKNIATLASIAGGLIAMKIAEFFIAGAAAIYSKVTAVVAHVTSLQAERAALIAATQAEIATASAQLATATATKAAIISVRENTISQLQGAQANIASAEAAIAAANAAGAQSFALRALRISTLELSVAQTRQAALVAELALLGQQQARVSAQIAAASTAEAAARNALNAANAGGTVGAGLLGRAMGALGGPIGAITTVIGLGVTAWMLWGKTTREQTKSAAQEATENFNTIIAGLDKQIEKNQRIIDLRKQGASEGAARSIVDSKPRAELGAQGSALAALNSGTGRFQSMGSYEKGEERAKIMARILELTQKINAEESTGVAAAAATRQEALIGLNKEYATSSEQLAMELDKVRKALGGMIPPELEAKIRDKFKDTAGVKEAAQSYKASIAALEAKQALEKEIMQGGLSEAESLYRQGIISQSQYLQQRLDGKLTELEMLRSFTQKELDMAGGKDQLAIRQKYIGELAVIEQRRKNVIAGAENEIREVISAREQDYQKSLNDELVALSQSSSAIDRKIASYEMLPEAITAATIAQLMETRSVLESMGGANVAIEGINLRIAALDKLRAAQQRSATQDLLGGDAKKIGAEWASMGTVIGNALTTAFGRGGKAVGEMVKGITGFKRAQDDIAKNSKDRMKSLVGMPNEIKKEEIRAAQETEQARVGAYANMLGAAKEYFGEHTAGYKLLEAGEKAYRAYEMYLALESFVTKTSLLASWFAVDTTVKAGATATDTTFTIGSIAKSGMRATADGIAAIAKSISSVPYPWNIVAGATTAAALIAAGVAVFGGGGGGGGGGALPTAKEMQERQGRGTVLGDDKAVSNSIGNSLENMESNSNIALRVSSEMLIALRNIESALGGAAKGIFQTAGLTGGSAFGTQNTHSENFFGSDTRTDITDSGLRFSGSLGQLRAGQGRGTQYENVTKFDDGGWFHGDRTWNETNSKDLTASMTKQFSMVFDSMGDLLVRAGVQLGSDAGVLTNAINQMSLDFSVSTRGLKGQDLVDALSAGVSVAFDQVASDIFPQVAQFQKVGEGMGETLVRVAGGVDTAEFALEKLGITMVGLSDVAYKQGDIAAELVRDSILKTQTLGTTLTGIGDIMRTLDGTAQELADTFNDLTNIQQSLSAVGISGLEVTRDLVRGAGDIATLQNSLDDYMENYFSQAEQLAAKTETMRTKFSALGVVMPDSIEGFNKLVVSIPKTTIEGQRLLGGVLGLAGGFADLFEEVKKLSTKEIVSNYDEAGRTVKDALRKIGDTVQEFAQRLKDAEAGTKAARDAISSAYFDAQDEVETAQAKVNDLLKESALVMAEFATSVKAFLNSIGTSSLDQQSNLRELKAQFSSTAVLAAADDKKSQDKFVTIGQKLLEMTKGQARDGMEYAIGEARVKAIARIVAEGADGKAGGIDPVDPMLEAQNELVAAQKRLGDLTMLAVVTGANTDRATRETANSATSLLAAYNAAVAAEAVARHEYNMASLLTQNLALTISKSMDDLLSQLVELGEAQLAFMTSKGDLAKTIVDTEVKAGNLDTYASNLVTQLGLTGTAAERLTLLLQSPADAVTTLTTLLGTGASNVEQSTDKLIESLGLTGTGATQFKEKLAGVQGALPEIVTALKGTGAEAEKLAALLGPTVLGAQALSLAKSFGMVGEAAELLDSLIRGIQPPAPMPAPIVFGPAPGVPVPNVTPSLPVVPGVPNVTAPAPVTITHDQSTIAAAYAQYLGRAPESAGMDFWLSKAGSAIPMEYIIDAIRTSPEAEAYKSIRGFALGGDHMGGLRKVGEYGMEIEATGPARYWSAQKTTEMMNGGSGGSNEQTNKKIADMADKMDKLEEAATKSEQHDRELLNLFKQLTDGTGQYLLVKAES